MAHLHSIYDTDKHFNIDPITRNITSESEKMTLMQYDHNSERFTFEIPRFIEGHDMSISDTVRIHYINIGSTSTDRQPGVYEVDDVQISPDSDDIVIFSWLISRNSTQFNGTLNFAIRFNCITNDELDYSWGTGIFTGIKVSNGLDNSEEVVEDYADVLEQWKRELYSRIDSIESKVEDIEMPEIPEFPTSLPNPNSVTFTGAVNAVYDGSEAITVNIPDGSNGTDSNSVHYTEDADKTDEEKNQARLNIGAASTDDLNTKIDTSDVTEMEITNAETAVNDISSDEKLITPAAVQKLIDRLLMPPIKIFEEYNVDSAVEWVKNSTTNVQCDFITKSGVLYICITDSPAGTWSNVSGNYKAVTLDSVFNYDPLKTYYVGDKCIYSSTSNNQKLYVCIVDGASGEFNADDWKDVGYAFSVDSEVDFRNYIDCFSHGLGKINSNGLYVYQEQFNEDAAFVAFRRSTYKSTAFYGMFYDKNTGKVSNFRYASSRYITE